MEQRVGGQFGPYAVDSTDTLAPETVFFWQVGGGAAAPSLASNFFVMCTGQVEFGEVKGA